MATERNPFNTIPEEISNVVQLPTEQEEGEPTFELDPDGGVTVDFTETTIEMEAEEDIQEWYGNLAETVDEERLQEISTEVYNTFTADRDSRQEWESMFERGFDLLGLKIEDASEPFEGACTAVHPMLIESAVKFQSKAIQE